MMIILDYNERKLLILEAMVEMPGADSNEICETLGDSTLPTIGMALLHYYRQGLLHREKQGGIYRYRLTTKGYERLKYLQTVETIS